MELYGPLAEFLAHRVDRTPIFLQRHCYGDINELLRWGQCDVAVVGAYAFIQGERDFGMEILAVPESSESAGRCSYIVTRQSSAANSLLDLRGKRFAFVDYLSEAGWLYPASWLMEHAENPREFFSEQVVTEGHDRSLRLVATGYVDGAAVDSVLYDRMMTEHSRHVEQTKVIAKSPPLGPPPLVVHPSLDPILRHGLEKALFGMADDPEGQKVLSLLKTDRFVPGRAALYDESQRRADEVEKY